MANNNIFFVGDYKKALRYINMDDTSFITYRAELTKIYENTGSVTVFNYIDSKEFETKKKDLQYRIKHLLYKELQQKVWIEIVNDTMTILKDKNLLVDSHVNLHPHLEIHTCLDEVNTSEPENTIGRWDNDKKKTKAENSKKEWFS